MHSGSGPGQAQDTQMGPSGLPASGLAVPDYSPGWFSADGIAEDIITGSQMASDGGRSDR